MTTNLHCLGSVCEVCEGVKSNIQGAGCAGCSTQAQSAKFQCSVLNAELKSTNSM